MQHSVNFSQLPSSPRKDSYAPSASTWKSHTSVYFKDTEMVPEMTIDRARFKGRQEYLLCLIGKVVGPGNMWRVPYLVYKNGGTPFIVCYILAAFLVGVPVAFVELMLGQFSGDNCVQVFDFSPAFRGLGFTMCLVSMAMSLYFHVIMAYVLHYLINSFQSNLPWNICKEEWTNCFTDFSILKNLTLCGGLVSNDTHKCYCDAMYSTSPDDRCLQPPSHAARYYFYEVVTGHHIPQPNIADGYGLPSWQLTAILLFSWLFVTFCISKGIRYTSKVAFVTVLSPYIGFLFLIVNSSLLEGAGDGMRYLFSSSDWTIASTVGFWTDVFGQALFGMAAGTGSHFMFGSYNNFQEKSQMFAVIVCVVDLLTSVMAAISVFLVLGYQAKRSGLQVENIIKADMNMVFVAYPSALSSLPNPQGFSVIFFLLLYILSIDTEFGCMETFLTYLQDDFRLLRRNSLMFRYITGLCGFLLSVLLVTPLGIHILHSFDYLLLAFVVPNVCLLELIAVFWVYGFNNFMQDLELMLCRSITGKQFWFIYLVFLLPISLIVVIIAHYAHGITVPSDWSKTFIQVLFPLMVLPILVWLCFQLRAQYYKHGKFGAKVFFVRLRRPMRRWVANDGSKVHRRINSVFADVFPSLRRRSPKPASTHELPFARVSNDILQLSGSLVKCHSLSLVEGVSPDIAHDNGILAQIAQAGQQPMAEGKEPALDPNQIALTEENATQAAQEGQAANQTAQEGEEQAAQGVEANQTAQEELAAQSEPVPNHIAQSEPTADEIAQNEIYGPQESTHV